jgi:hypothetical protein
MLYDVNSAGNTSAAFPLSFQCRIRSTHFSSVVVMRRTLPPRDPGVRAPDTVYLEQVKELTIPAGTPIFLGRPKNPLPEELVLALGRVVDSIEGVTEAHLPQCFAPAAMQAPAQILVLVLGKGASPDAVRDHLAGKLPKVLGGSEHLDVWLLRPDAPSLEDVRGASCRIGTRAAPQRGWRFWKTR